MRSPPRPSDPCAARPPRPGPPTLRPRSGQPCALSILGGLHACATARRTRVRLRVASRANRRQSATVCPASDPDRGRVWPPWSSSAARPSPFFGRVVPQPRVFALLPAPRARHIPRYVVGEAPPPRLAGVPHPRRRTVGLKSASAGLRTLEAASPAAAARFLRYLVAARLCLALARRVTAAKRGARFERADPSDREGEPTVARESFAGPA